jgi:hypothetical protein
MMRNTMHIAKHKILPCVIPYAGKFNQEVHIYNTIVNPKHGKGASSFGIPSIKSLMSSGEIKGIQEVFQPARLAVMPHLL